MRPTQAALELAYPSGAGAITKANVAPIAARPVWPAPGRRPLATRRRSAGDANCLEHGRDRLANRTVRRFMCVTGGRSWQTGERNPSRDDLGRSIECVRLGVTTQTGQMH
jgi:hypothetical protein